MRQKILTSVLLSQNYRQTQEVAQLKKIQYSLISLSNKLNLQVWSLFCSKRQCFFKHIHGSGSLPASPNLWGQTATLTLSLPWLPAVRQQWRGSWRSLCWQWLLGCEEDSKIHSEMQVNGKMFPPSHQLSEQSLHDTLPGLLSDLLPSLTELSHGNGNTQHLI